MLGVKSSNELRSIIYHRIDTEGPTVDLNDIDTSSLTDLDAVFYGVTYEGALSWDISNVTSMDRTFADSKVNINLNNLDTSKVTSMKGTFSRCTGTVEMGELNTCNVTDMSRIFNEANITCDISKWTPYKLETLYKGFYLSDITSSIADWCPDGIIDMRSAFHSSSLRSNIYKWDLRKVRYIYKAFYGSTIRWDFNSIIPSNLLDCKVLDINEKDLEIKQYDIIRDILYHSRNSDELQKVILTDEFISQCNLTIDSVQVTIKNYVTRFKLKLPLSRSRDGSIFRIFINN